MTTISAVNKRTTPSKRQNGEKSKKAKKRERLEEQEWQEEQQLASLVFGKSPTTKWEPRPQEAEDFDDPEAPLFEIDRSGNDGIAVGLDGPALATTEANQDDTHLTVDTTNNEEAAPAWIDEDDAALRVDLLATSRLRKLRKSREEEEASSLTGTAFESRLRQRYEESSRSMARMDWADVASDNKEDKKTSEEPWLSSSSPLLLQPLSSVRSSLPPNIINMKRCPDANESDPSKAVVQCVNFHANSDRERPLLLTAGLDKTLRFFHVGADQSEKVHGIHFPKLPIYSASFLGSSGNVVVSGRRPFFYIYDAVAGSLDLVPRIVSRQEKSLEKHTTSPDGTMIAFVGNDGYIILVDVRTKQWIADLKMNGSVRAITFSRNGDYLLASGSDGDVYRWDIASRRCVERFGNQDGTITASMDCSSGHLAVGAESGVVNVYHSHRSTINTSSTVLNRSVEPIKAILNLHTSADMVKFNHDGQILAMSSRRERQGLKLLHVPTQTVFSNWPTSKTPLNYVWSLDFSPQSRFLAIGNDKGKCLLYRLSHYDSEL